MAQKRMFDKTITNSDDFLEMPDSSQNLYFHLSMNADDDGFINNWKSIMRMTGHKEDDLKVLIAKQFIIPFDSGVIVIRHWRINNYLRNDRYTETKFKEEMSKLRLDNNLVYQLDTTGIPLVDTDKIRLDKNRLDNNIGSANAKQMLSQNNGSNKKFKKPTLDEVKEYCKERNNNVDADDFIDYYEKIGWVYGKNRLPIKDWKACVRTWEKKNKKEVDTSEWF